MAKAASKATVKKAAPKKEAAAQNTSGIVDMRPERSNEPAIVTDTAKEAEQAAKVKKGDYKVEKGVSFRDIADYNKVYGEGEDVSHFAPQRISDLLEKGYIIKSK